MLLLDMYALTMIIFSNTLLKLLILDLRPVPRGGSVGSDEPPSLQRGPLLNTTHLSLVVPQ